MVRIALPKDVKHIIDVLMENGYEAYAVGGCVRDSILGRVPGDWDITTSALPMQVKGLFRRTVDTGIQHGTVTVMLGRNGYEVTTYRIDGKYEDSRHPESVEFTPKLEEDLKRRDFTINAMAYNDEHGIVDIFDGVGDLQRKIIRCVGNAHDRFDEDALRILRAVRFSAQLGFGIEENTARAAKELAVNLKRISSERIHTEFNKMLKSPHPDYFSVADAIGIMEIVLPEYHVMSAEDKAFVGALARECACQLPERYAAMLFMSGRYSEEDPAEDPADTAKRVLKRLKLDNDTINTASMLLRFGMLEITDDEPRIRHIIYETGDKNILRILDFRAAYEKCIGNDITDVRRMYDICNMIFERGDCVSLKNLAITGRELIAMGVPAGRQMGEILNSLLMLVLDNPQLNDREQLSKEALKILNS
ncbi:MAG TPA: CCA tRNA nucleotidyltransferase [Eubacterium sp.]|nr:CCA tRNA nucleotidyltransferase [Eubacterium sp.]HAZ86075.1 CCA tRNA nucleotidyltransferase [Eubacterium sp.]